jgi:beta-N-acetylhexosaminidase
LDLYPFKQAILNKIDMIMVAHVAVPSLDDNIYYSDKSKNEIIIPATLSQKILRGYLRDELGYNGVIISDALTMKAISSHFDELDAIIASIISGVNLLLMPCSIRSASDILNFDIMFNLLVKEYYSNDIFSKRVRESYEYIVALKQSNASKINNYRKYTKSDQIKMASNILRSNKYYENKLTIAADGITCLRNGGLLPLSFDKFKNILIYDTCSIRLDIVFQFFEQKSSCLGVDITCKTYKYTAAETVDLKIKEKTAGEDLVIMISENLDNTDNFASKMTSMLVNANYQVLNIASNLPYDIKYLPDAVNYYCLYGASRSIDGSDVICDLDINLIAFLELSFSKNICFKGSSPVKVM